MTSNEGKARIACTGHLKNDQFRVGVLLTLSPDLNPGQTTQARNYHVSVISFLDGAPDWEISVNLMDHDRYPELIREYRMRPDIVLHTELPK